MIESDLAPVAQSEEYPASTRNVGGSSPSGSGIVNQNTECNENENNILYQSMMAMMDIHNTLRETSLAMQPKYFELIEIRGDVLGSIVVGWRKLCHLVRR